MHANGAGAHGTFTLTHPVPDLTCAKLFSSAPGTTAPLTVRYSPVSGETGSPDTARDPRGFAIKLRTEEGNRMWSLSSGLAVTDRLSFLLIINSSNVNT